MAHYAYKYACYDIDYEKYCQLVKKFEEEAGRKHDGDSNYDGDNWLIMEMWINELIEENNKLKNDLRKAQENPLQDKLDAIANKVVFGKAQEK
jgi:hypothetical protein